MDAVTPPDLQTAGAAQPPQDTQGLVGALRAGGSPPSGLMEALRPPQLTGPMMLASAAAQGLNPTQINPVVRQQNIEHEQQIQQVQMIQRAQETQQRQQMHKNAAALSVLTGIVSDPGTSDATMKAIGPQYQALVKQATGVDIPASALNRTVPVDQRNKMLRDLASGVPDEMVTKQYPWVQKDLPKYKQLIASGNEDLFKQIGSKTPSEYKKEALDIQTKEADLFNKKHPELADKQLAAYAFTLHQQLNHKPYWEGDPTSQAQVVEMARIKLIDEDIAAEKRKLNYQSQLQSQRDIAAENRMVLRDQLGQGKATKLADQKRMQSITVAETFLKQFEDYIPKLKKAGFLPGGSGLFASGQAAAKQGHIPIPGISKPNDPVWRGWLDLQGNMIGFARSVQNDIGPRAMAAFQQAVRVSEHPPTEEGLRVITAQMREQLESAKRGPSTGPLSAPVMPMPPEGYRPVQ